MSNENLYSSERCHQQSVDSRDVRAALQRDASYYTAADAPTRERVPCASNDQNYPSYLDTTTPIATPYDNRPRYAMQNGHRVQVSASDRTQPLPYPKSEGPFLSPSQIDYSRDYNSNASPTAREASMQRSVGRWQGVNSGSTFSSFEALDLNAQPGDRAQSGRWEPIANTNRISDYSAGPSQNPSDNPVVREQIERIRMQTRLLIDAYAARNR